MYVVVNDLAPQQKYINMYSSTLHCARLVLRVGRNKKAKVIIAEDWVPGEKKLLVRSRREYSDVAALLASRARSEK